MKAAVLQPRKPVAAPSRDTPPAPSRTATVADLRNHFRRVSAWIENGETVEIVKRGRPFARLAPLPRQRMSPSEVDWEGRLQRIWGDRVFSQAEVEEMRAFELEGQEG